jgi:hypothetical protein
MSDIDGGGPKKKCAFCGAVVSEESIGCPSCGKAVFEAIQLEHLNGPESSEPTSAANQEKLPTKKHRWWGLGKRIVSDNVNASGRHQLHRMDQSELGQIKRSLVQSLNADRFRAGLSKIGFQYDEETPAGVFLRGKEGIVVFASDPTRKSVRSCMYAAFSDRKAIHLVSEGNLTFLH